MYMSTHPYMLFKLFIPSQATSHFAIRYKSLLSTPFIYPSGTTLHPCILQYTPVHCYDRYFLQYAPINVSLPQDKSHVLACLARCAIRN